MNDISATTLKDCIDEITANVSKHAPSQALATLGEPRKLPESVISAKARRAGVKDAVMRISARSGGPLFAALALALTGCSKPDSGPAAPPGASTPMPVAAAVPSATPAAPAMKSYTDPLADRLGVLAPGTGIPVGQKVPDIHARDLNGNDVSLAGLYTKGPILLAFYRGGWCPFCASENHALATAYSEYQKRGVMPVTVSVDKPDQEAKTKATYNIPFPVLSDSDATMIEAFHVVNKVDDATFAKMHGFGIDLESYSGKAHHEIAIPSLFLIDRQGVVRWAHSDPDYKVRPSTAQILAAIDGAHLG